MHFDFKHGKVVYLCTRGKGGGGTGHGLHSFNVMKRSDEIQHPVTAKLRK